MTEERLDPYQEQVRYCEENGLPVFISESCRCPRCYGNLFGEGGIRPERAGEMLITSCPRCNASFCD